MTTTQSDNTWLDDILNDIEAGLIQSTHKYGENIISCREHAKAQAKTAILDHLQEHERLARIEENYILANMVEASRADETRTFQNILQVQPVPKDMAIISRRLAELKATPDTKQERTL